MEQAILNPAKFTITDLSIDTRFADQYNNGTADFTIRLPDTYKNIMRMRLSSVEVPLVESVFSARRRNIVFYVQGVAVTIPTGNYDAKSLAAAVQTAMRSVLNTLYPPQPLPPPIPVLGTATCVYDEVANRFVITVDPSVEIVLYDAPTPLTKRYWGLGYYMGFRTSMLFGATSYTGTQPPQLGPTPYYLMQVSCPDQVETTIHSTGAQSWIPALAKIVLRRGIYAVQFDDGANKLRKEIVFASPSNVGQLRVRLVDPYGSVVDLGDVDWSMTFELTAVVSSCKYDDLNGAFGRC
jgi:hypothetical protein